MTPPHRAAPACSSPSSSQSWCSCSSSCISPASSAPVRTNGVEVDKSVHSPDPYPDHASQPLPHPTVAAPEPDRRPPASPRTIPYRPTTATTARRIRRPSRRHRVRIRNMHPARRQQRAHHRPRRRRRQRPAAFATTTVREARNDRQTRQPPRHLVNGTNGPLRALATPDAPRSMTARPVRRVDVAAAVSRFRVSRHTPTEWYPYGYERAEDLTGIGIAIVIWGRAAPGRIATTWGSARQLGWDSSLPLSLIRMARAKRRLADTARTPPNEPSGPC